MVAKWRIMFPDKWKIFRNILKDVKDVPDRIEKEVSVKK